ncbi:hypothetical protein ACVCIH_27845 [Burkholderia glumae]|uniref:hypothetical protein n=1 Tax=Burkholderia glumae TaxID=337 RepID=UPI0020374E14|nr:hypothetical protein [Burkholderia glumae]MCM2495715.1 hypothetical protein [Burkholderia glumae]
MSDNVLNPVPAWTPVPQLEVKTLAAGGPGGVMNAQAQALANRTEALADNTDSANGARIVGFKGPLPNESGRNVYLNLIEQVRVSRWNVDPNQSAAANNAGMQRAIAAKGSKACFVFAEGDYHFSDKIPTIAGMISYFRGDGTGVTRFVQDNLKSDLLEFNLGYAQGGGIEGITLTSNVEPGEQGSSGVALRVTNANDNFFARHFEILSYDQGVELNGSYQPSFKDGRILYFGKFGIHMTPYTGGTTETAGSKWDELKISNYGYTGPSPENSIGLFIEQGSGEFFSRFDITQTGRGVVVKAPSGSWGRFLKFREVLSDTSLFEGWTFDGTLGQIVDVRMTDCYSAGSGGGVFRPNGSTRGAGLLTIGPNLDDLSWLGGEIRDNDCGGWDHRGGTNCRLGGQVSITRNSRRVVMPFDVNPPSSFSNVYPGVIARAGVSYWALDGATIGNASLGVFNVEQAEAVVIEQGASRGFKIQNCTLDNPGTGKLPIANGSTTNDWIIKDNSPLQTLGVNTSTRWSIQCKSIGTIAASAIAYIGPNGQFVSVWSDPYIAEMAGIVTELYASCLDAPGDGETFTYTVFLNGYPTSIAGTITGNAKRSIYITGITVRYLTQDQLSLEVKTSSGARVTSHQAYYSLER